MILDALIRIGTFLEKNKLMSVTRIILCADDFGMTKGVSEAILDLAAMKRISATSVMVNRPWWISHGPDLKSLPISIGLHLNLTLGQPLGPMPHLACNGVFPFHSELLRKSLTGSLHIGEIRVEIERQLDAFAAVMGRMPDHLDGHQHIHVLPAIRRALFQALKAKGLEKKLWLRDPSDRFFAILRRRAFFKALLVKGLSFGFARAAKRHGFTTNQGFSGFSHFKKDASVASIENDFMRHFQKLGLRPVVMCHPGYIDDELYKLDPVIEPRAREVMYFSSGLFQEALEGLNMELASKLA
jgi:chitin disaccharide deacetylase